MLRWARESINLQIEEAASRLRVKPERLAGWEGGQRLPTVEQLRRAATVYRRPLAAFFLPAPPKDFHVPHDFRRLPHQPPAPLSPEFIAEVRRAQFRRSLAIELAEETVDTPRRFIGSVSRAIDIDAAAQGVRQLLGVPIDEQRSWQTEYHALNRWKDAIENLGVFVFHFSGVEVDEIRAFSICEQPFPVISINGRDAPTGRTFSLLHEFGHLLLDHGGTCDLREHDRVRSANQEVEVFCNYLAGAVLVPRDELEHEPLVRGKSTGMTWEDSALQTLAHSYRVSREVILRRLLIIGRTSRTFYRQKREELGQLPPQKREKGTGFLSFPRRIIRALGQPFLRIVLNAYYREAITASDLAEYLGARLKHLPALEHHLAGPNVLTGGDR